MGRELIVGYDAESAGDGSLAAYSGNDGYGFIRVDSGSVSLCERLGRCVPESQACEAQYVEGVVGVGLAHACEVEEGVCSYLEGVEVVVAIALEAVLEVVGADILDVATVVDVGVAEGRSASDGGGEEGACVDGAAGSDGVGEIFDGRVVSDVVRYGIVASSLCADKPSAVGGGGLCVEGEGGEEECGYEKDFVHEFCMMVDDGG